MLLTYLILIFSSISFADLESGIKPSVPGISLPNTHLVSISQGKLYRSMIPTNYIDDIKKLNINQILVFKTDDKGDVAKEIVALKKAGYESNQITIIPFKWKDIIDFTTPCEQTVQALNILKKAESTANTNLLFHCTVGEDRTGYLAGLYNIWTKKMPRDKTFKEELCEKGFEAGNGEKPQKVVDTVRNNLIPLFFKMALVVENNQTLTPELCKQEPVLAFDPMTYRCQQSSQMRPKR